MRDDLRIVLSLPLFEDIAWSAVKYSNLTTSYRTCLCLGSFEHTM